MLLDKKVEQGYKADEGNKMDEADEADASAICCPAKMKCSLSVDEMAIAAT